MYNAPQVEIQSDALQICFELAKEISDRNPNTVWLRIGQNSFNLHVANGSMIDKEHDLKLVQEKNRPTCYKLFYGQNEPFNLVFPSAHFVLGVDKHLNLTRICGLPNMFVLGTSNGDLIKFGNPIPFNISKFVLKENAHYADVTHVLSFSSGSVLLTIGIDMQIKIWKNDSKDLDFGSPIRILKGIHQGRITDCVMIGRGRNIVSCGLDGQIVFWELGSGEAVWKGRRIRDLHDGCTSLCISKITSEETHVNSEMFFECDGKVLWSGHVSGTVSVWDCSTRLSLGEFPTNQDGYQVQQIEALETMNGVIIGLNNGNVILFTYDFNQRKAIKVWEVNVEKPENEDGTIDIKKIRAHKSLILVLTDNYLACLDLKTGHLISSFVGYDDSVNDFYVSDMGNTSKVVVAGKRGFLSMFKL
ncbi:hypothetical protein PICMEDRAFT_16071 [Pichia membranifaciens NRRL Y-2026]|uniref:Uncharacterized protein n=1 Tax=Pichia membranifaciens NRRL Y-2026 TaxID=763406 RepID=A0A1E3NQ77_9ASCO|nr:hypothetical protein PICMEDRAFT_16071 [Pichia membranifaciens NRRL Y-2026]ODQ48264.1 hypothetical protein PICMEDRAFT_16071 [Pichia membranifaciens NRRL Y-2026]